VRARRLASVAVPPALVFAAVIGVWFFVSYVVLEPRRRFLLPPPQDVVRVGFLDPDNLDEILTALGQSIEVALAGLAIAAVVGIGFAVAMSQARWIERSLYPWAVVLQTVPILAIVPLIGFWFKFGFPSRVLVCVLISLFPIVTNTLFGLKSAAREHHELFTLNDASRAQRLWLLQLPWALPAIFTGLRISAGLSVIGAIVGDFFFQQGPPGLGRLLSDYTYQLQSEQLVAAVFFCCLLGLVVFWLFGLAGRLVTGSWHESYAPE
jgi:NitT/TauT family transport system permease protein